MMNILGFFCSLTFLCCSTRNCLPPQDQPSYGLAQLRERSRREPVYAGAGWELEHADEIATLPNRQSSPWMSEEESASDE